MLTDHVRDLTLADVADAAALHARCFADPWGAEVFAGLIAGPAARAMAMTGPGGMAGFAVVQVVAGEADILTIATAPERRGEGVAAALIDALVLQLGGQGVRRLTLDVAEDNWPARRLYARSGFAEDGRRRGYYVAARDVPVDAILMSRMIAPG